MVNTDHLIELLNSRPEWLLIRETGRSFSLTSREVRIDANGEVANLRFLDHDGVHSRLLSGFSFDDGEISIDIAEHSGESAETIRFIARTPASDLSAEVELARLEKANEIAALITANFPGSKIGRVALNAENGRLAQINFDDPEKEPTAAVADITGMLTVESIFTAGILWLEKLGLRKNRPVMDLWIICEKRQARNAQKLHALLNERWKSKITVFEVHRKNDPPEIKKLPKRKIRELWREKAQKLTLPADADVSETAARITALAPDLIDTIYSRNGETLRFLGLPFARVRVMADGEKAWFGVGRERRVLSSETWDDLVSMVGQLVENRSPQVENKRHELYRTAPEAWLESILRRNIRALDANLILSPIYNQFRSSNDKIDLLALRRDGRLVIIELKTQPDREMVFQAADYWRKIELQRRRGILAAADLFEGREILDQAALIYLAAPAWSFHRDFEFFARAISPEIELWRFELHENWRQQIKVLARHNYADQAGGITTR